MSVYPRKRKNGATVWHYDFVIEGRRFHGATGQTTRRAAETFEARKRQEVASGVIDRPELTLDVAAGRWWADVGRHRSDAKDKERCIEWLIDRLGKTTLASAIRTSEVLELVAARRDEHARNVARDRGKVVGKARRVTAATVNRDVIGTLRPILRHAEAVFEDPLPRILWAKASLREGDTPVREEFSSTELSAWMRHLGPIERAFLAMSSLYGLRFGEMFFPPDAVEASDPLAARLRIARYKGRSGWREFRKGGGAHVIPLLEPEARLLGALAARARAAGIETIWAEDHGARLEPISYWGMHQRLRSAAKRAGLRPGRLIHGLRHHAATQILRVSGNLMLAKQTLGHSHVGTTQRYAHASDADVREGLAAIPRYSPDTPNVIEQDMLENKGD